LRNARYNLLLLRHRIADVLIGPLGMALLPVTLLFCFWLDGDIVFMVVSILAPALLIGAAWVDHHRRQRPFAVGSNRSDQGERTFETTLKSALYRGHLRRSTVICAFVKIDWGPNGNIPTTPKATGRRTYENLLLLQSLVRRRDQVFCLGHARFGAVLNTGGVLSHDQVAERVGRLQNDFDAAVSPALANAVHGVAIGASYTDGSVIIQAQDLVGAAKRAVAASHSERKIVVEHVCETATSSVRTSDRAKRKAKTQPLITTGDVSLAGPQEQ
jgi:hypothetical protein